MRILLALIFMALLAPVWAQEGFGVLTMSTGPAAPAKPAKAVLPQPSPLRVDDGDILNRKGRDLYRHKVCIDGQYVAIYDYGISPKTGERHTRRLEGARAVKCNYYYGANTPAARQYLINEAKKEFNFYNVYGASVTESTPWLDPLAQRFPLDKMKTAPVTNFDEEAGAIYKLILTDKAKIKRLSNYTYDQIALQLGETLPLRITVYEDYTPGSDKAIAVFTFKDKQKHIFDVDDLNKSGMVYDIKPDFALKYTPA